MPIYRIGQELKSDIAWMDNDMYFRRQCHYPDFDDWFETTSMVRARRAAARWPFGTVEVIEVVYDEQERPAEMLVQPSLW